MKYLLAVCAALVAILSPLKVSAAEPRYYFSVGAGLDLLDDRVRMSFAANDITVPFSSVFDPTDGVRVSASLGVMIGHGIRVEVEGSRSRHSFERAFNINAFATTEMPTFGRVLTHSLMVNAFYDLNFMKFGPIVPYVGAGAGVAWRDYKMGYAFGTSEVYRWDSSNPSFAYQLMAGASFAFTDRVSLTLEYRYFRALDSAVDGTGRFAFGGQVRPYSDRVELGDNIFSAGLRFQF